MVPLSRTLDSIGYITRTISDAKILQSVFTQSPPNLSVSTSEDLDLLVCSNDLVWNDIHPEVLAALDRAIDKIEKSGATVTRNVIPEFDETILLVNAKGNIVHYEGYKKWGDFLNARPEIISSDILAIFNMGAEITDSHIGEVYAGLKELNDHYTKTE